MSKERYNVEDSSVVNYCKVLRLGNELRYANSGIPDQKEISLESRSLTKISIEIGSVAAAAVSGRNSFRWVRHGAERSIFERYPQWRSRYAIIYLLGNRNRRVLDITCREPKAGKDEMFRLSLNPPVLFVVL